MILDDGNGTRLELRVAWSTRLRAGREITPYDYLLVTVDADTPHGSWSAQDDLCLTAADAFQIATWLQAIGQGRRQPDVVSFQEPNISFSRDWDAPLGHLRLRVGLEMETPEAIAAAYGLEDREFFLEFLLTAEQVIEAGMSLEREVRNLAAAAGIDVAALAGAPELTPTFFISWTFLPRDASTREEAISAVRSYMDQRDIPIEIETCEPGDGWLVRGRTVLPVPSDNSAEAVYHFLSRVPIPYGRIDVGRTWLTTDGRFHWTIVAVPLKPPDWPIPFEDIRWRSVLTNFESDDSPTFNVRLAFAYFAGDIDGRGLPRRW